MRKNKVEVIAWTVEDAKRIEAAGADRIELIVDLKKGGLTPPYELVKEVSEIATIPVRVMVRDTWDSFVYSKEVMDSHIKYIESMRDLNIEGIIFGSLDETGKLNLKDLERVIAAKGNLKLTYHRAFDELDEKDAVEEFRKLSKYDIDWLLTAGTKTNAQDGIPVIKKLVEEKTINVLAGTSISIKNAQYIIDETGVNFIHVGTSVREDHTADTELNIDKIKALIEEIN